MKHQRYNWPLLSLPTRQSTSSVDTLMFETLDIYNGLSLGSTWEGVTEF